MVDNRDRQAQHDLMRRSCQLACLLLSVLVAGVLAPVRSGSSADSDVDRRVDAIIAKMTLEQKIDYIGGVDNFHVRAMPEIGVPARRMADGPMGVRNYGPATAMAAGINLAATWDPALAERVGTQIGLDARAKGVNFLLGPGLNIYRAPMNGRNFEYFGEDPFLAGRIAVGYINGVQSQGVSATVKHFMANNSEFDRHNTDAIIDERTMREIYLPAFEAAVKDAHVGAVMNSYNLVNGVHSTQNETLDTEILKKEWGFQGVLMSDWVSTYDGVAAANAGLDLEMPMGMFMNRQSLLPAVRDGRVSVAVIDDKVRRILRLAVRSHWLDRDQTDLSVPRYNLDGRRAAMDAAREGIVLLKNEASVLPLNKHTMRSVAIVGPDAYPAVPLGGGSAGVRPFAAVSFLQGISSELGPSVHTEYRRGIPELNELAEATAFSSEASGGSSGLAAEYFSNPNLEGDPIIRRNDLHIDFGVAPNSDLGFGVVAAYPPGAGSSRWTGYYTVSTTGPYDVFVQSSGEAGGNYRVYLDGKLALDDWSESRALVGLTTVALDSGPHKVVVEHRGRPGFLGMRFRFGIVRQDTYVDPAAEKIAALADAVVVAVGFDPESESEGADRTFRLPPGQDQLIQEMTEANKNTIVVLTSGGGADMNAWIDRVPALLEAWYPGQEGGKAAAEILFGDVNPSGRLAATFERRWEDNPVHDSYYPAAGSNRVIYKEGVFVGYRGYEHNGTKPLFTFGYGLSYTSFNYGNLAIKPVDSGAKNNGLSVPLYQVSFDVTNTGARAGADVAQIYVAEAHPRVPRPAKELKGFARINLKPGETKTSIVILDGRAFSYYDADAKSWRADPGEFQILVGRSSQDIQLHRGLTLSADTAAAANRK